MRRITLITASFVFVLSLGLAVGCSKKNDETGSANASPSPSAETKSAKAEISTKAPEDWLVVEDTTFIPVIDDVSRKMLEAQRAFLTKDNKTAAEDIRQSAASLSGELSGASVESQKQIQAAAKALEKLATDLDSNKISSVKQLDAVLVQAHGADIKQRWVEADETTWYPYVEEPDQHFKNAHDAFLSRDFKKTTEEIRKGEAFVKLEDARATGDAKRSLDASSRELAQLAGEASRGEVKDVKSLDNAFARADYALALSHRAKASEGRASKDATKAGYELRAAANYLEQGASRAGSDVESGVSAGVKDTREVAGKLIQGTSVAADDVDKAMETVGQEIGVLGKKVMHTKP
jgi:hypothetical protein